MQNDGEEGDVSEMSQSILWDEHRPENGAAVCVDSSGSVPCDSCDELCKTLERSASK